MPSFSPVRTTGNQSPRPIGKQANFPISREIGKLGHTKASYPVDSLECSNFPRPFWEIGKLPQNRQSSKTPTPIGWEIGRLGAASAKPTQTALRFEQPAPPVARQAKAASRSRNSKTKCVETKSLSAPCSTCGRVGAAVHISQASNGVYCPSCCPDCAKAKGATTTKGNR
jgi:hypothetical protein